MSLATPARLGRAVVIGLILAASVLAGCAEKTAPVASDPDVIPLNTIRGAVVDDSITPVEGVAITMGERATVTDAAGEFVFDDVTAGFYVILATRDGFYDSVVQVTVSDATPTGFVRIMLDRDLENLAFYQEFHIQGYVQCGTYTAPYSFAACGTGNVGSVILCSYTEGAFCLGNVTDDRYITIEWFEETPDFLQLEMAWQSTQPTGDRLRILIGSATPEQLEAVGSSVYNQSTGPSPLLATIGQEDLQESGIGRDAYFLSQTFATSSELMPCTPLGCLGVGATIEQEFELFFHLFHGYKPPSDWRFTGGAPVPEPPA